MTATGKIVSIVLIIILAASSLIMVKPAFADIPKPSVPEFTVKLYDASYDIPATTSTDPYNGQQVTHPGSHVEARNLVFRITNIPFTPYQIKDAGNNVWDVKLYYNIRWKGHFEQNQGWRVVFGPNFGYIDPTSGSETVYTVHGTIYSGNELDFSEWSCGVPTDAQIDIQFEALIGHPSSPYVFTGQESGWSNTQTISLNETALSPMPTTSPSQPTPTTTPSETTSATQNPTPTATAIQPDIQSGVLFGFDWKDVTIVLLAVVLCAVVMVVVLSRKRTAKATKQLTS